MPHMVEDLRRFTAIFAVTYFGIDVASVNEKYHLTIPLVDIVKLMCMQTFIKIYHMVEDLGRCPYFHMFWPRRYLGQ